MCCTIQVLALLQDLPDEDVEAEALQLLADRPDTVLARLLFSLSATPSDLEAFMRSPRDYLSSEALLEVDPMMAGFGDDALRVMLSIAAENIDSGLTICELGSGSGCFTKKVEMSCCS